MEVTPTAVYSTLQSSRKTYKSFNPARTFYIYKVDRLFYQTGRLEYIAVIRRVIDLQNGESVPNFLKSMYVSPSNEMIFPSFAPLTAGLLIVRRVYQVYIGKYKGTMIVHG